MSEAASSQQGEPQSQEFREESSPLGSPEPNWPWRRPESQNPETRCSPKAEGRGWRGGRKGERRRREGCKRERMVDGRKEGEMRSIQQVRSREGRKEERKVLVASVHQDAKLNHQKTDQTH